MKIKLLLALLFTSASIFLSAQVNLTNGLVAFYPLNGDASDSSSNSLDGTLIGTSSTSNRFGNSNSAISFNGSSDAITVAHNSLLNLTSDKTISVWYKITDSSNFNPYPTLIYKKGSTDYPTFGLYFREDNGYGASRFRPCFIQGSTINKEVYTKERYRDYVNQWVHVLISYSSSDGYMRIYFNGVLSDSLSAPAFVSNTSTESLQIGRGNSANFSANYFKGSLDDIRIYNRVLNDAEINAVYTETFSTSIDEVYSNAKTFIVYPNSFSTNVTIYSPNAIDNKVAVKIFDLQGKLVGEDMFANGDVVDLTYLKQGNYIFQIENNNVIERHRVVKQ